jgi:hypothetical protein
MKMLVVAVVLAAYAVTAAGLLQMPTYKASARVLVGERSPEQGPRDGKIQLIPLAPTPETPQMLTQTMARAIESRPVAREVIRRSGLRMDPDELLDNLTVEQVEDTNFIVLTSEDNNPMRRRGVLRAHLRKKQQLNGHRVAEGGIARNPGKPSPLEERHPYAGHRAGALRWDRWCQAERPCKGREHTWRTALPPSGRHSRARKREKAALSDRASREADGGAGIARHPAFSGRVQADP